MDNNEVKVVDGQAITGSDVFELGLLFQLACKSNEWGMTGITPNPKCNKCYGRGQVGRNMQGYLGEEAKKAGRNPENAPYLLCSCVTTEKQVKAAMAFKKEMGGILAKIKEVEEAEEVAKKIIEKVKSDGETGLIKGKTDEKV